MKKLSFALLILIFMIFQACETGEVRNIYMLKAYSIADSTDQEARMDSYLQNAYLPALHRLGIENIGVFKTITGKNQDQKLIVLLLPYSSADQFEETEKSLRTDESYLQDAMEFTSAAHDNPPYLRLESTLLRAFSATPLLHIPQLSSKKSERVYELRSYQSATEQLHLRKVEMFNEGESALFMKLGFEPMFFGEVISGTDMPNLMYMTCHENVEAQIKNWKAFVDSPEWNKMKVMEKYANTVSHIDKWMLYPAAYSDL